MTRQIVNGNNGKYKTIFLTDQKYPFVERCLHGGITIQNTNPNSTEIVHIEKKDIPALIEALTLLLCNGDVR